MIFPTTFLKEWLQRYSQLNFYSLTHLLCISVGYDLDFQSSNSSSLTNLLKLSSSELDDIILDHSKFYCINTTLLSSKVHHLLTQLLSTRF